MKDGFKAKFMTAGVEEILQRRSKEGHDYRPVMTLGATPTNTGYTRARTDIFVDLQFVNEFWNLGVNWFELNCKFFACYYILCTIEIPCYSLCEWKGCGELVCDTPKDPDEILSFNLYFPQSLTSPGGRLFMCVLRPLSVLSVHL